MDDSLNSDSRSSNRPADHQPSEREVTFSHQGIRAGFLLALPVALGVGGYGIAFGILATQAGLSVAEAAFMSATVVAGASQIVAVELWADPIPVVTVVVATTMINLRYSLMGAALQPWFRHLSKTQAYGSLLLMADENWALTLRDLQSGSGRGAFLLGSGLAVWIAWVVSSILGALAGNVIQDPRAYGIDFILVAVFVALVVGLWEGSESLFPWSIALVAALATAELLSGQWYILAGGLAAGIAEVIRYE